MTKINFASLKRELVVKPSEDKRLRGLILSAINKLVWARAQTKRDAENRCKVRVEIGEFKNGNKKYKVAYKCEGCGSIHDKLDCDHIEPRIDIHEGWISFDRWIDRTFVPASGLQMLCEDCHAMKTAKENGIRYDRRKEKAS